MCVGFFARIMLHTTDQAGHNESAERGSSTQIINLHNLYEGFCVSCTERSCLHIIN